MAARLDRQKEGSNCWVAGAGSSAAPRRATLAGSAWWTDAVGRSHARVVGRRLDPDNEYRTNRFGPLGHHWPPLGLVYPDRVALRTTFRARKTRRELLVLCACGAVGTVEALSWMGDCCGPCHDRQEEGQKVHSPPESERAAVVWNGGPVGGVACSAKGNLVQADMTGNITFRKGTGSIYLGAVGESLPFACNGKVAALAGYGGRAPWDADSGKQRMGVDEEIEGYLQGLALSPDGKHMAAISTDALDLWGLAATNQYEATDEYGDGQQRSHGWAVGRGRGAAAGDSGMALGGGALGGVRAERQVAGKRQHGRGGTSMAVAIAVAGLVSPA
ncbi:MAG: hypothetical protein L0Z62_44330 [Gemmataceae bacterium]|nr:hypothetical protein [Gemmataceae bacterium]